MNKPRKNAKKQNEELKTVVKRLQEEQFSYSILIKKPNTFKYLCGLSIEQFNILWNCVQPYGDVIIYPDCKGTGMRSQDNPTELTSKKILMGKWHLIQRQPYLRNIFQEPPLISYRKGKSLKDTLVRAKL